MATEDPPRLPAYLGQVERWVGGGLENLLKRVLDRDRRAGLDAQRALRGARRPAREPARRPAPVGLPAILGVAWPWGGAAAVGRGLAAWLSFDVAVTGTLVFAGSWYQARAPGCHPLAALGLAARRTLVGVLPLLLLRPINAVAYVAASTRVGPAFLRSRARAARVTVTWERPRAIARAPRTRIAGVTGGMLAVAVLGFTGRRISRGRRSGGARGLARPARGSEGRVGGPPALPVVSVVVRDVVTDASALSDGDLVPGFSGLAPAAQPVSPMPPTSAPRAACRSSASLMPSRAPHPSRDGSVRKPLVRTWGLLTLARLTPLVALIEEAASAYDVPPLQLLQLLLNESYLDPLAIGPTDDVGLSQVTSDTLRLLRTISEGGRSRFANPHLFARPFSAYDPDFSVCAGAAKLAWSRDQPHGADQEVAYARFINPLHGVVDGRVSDRHRPLVDAYVAVRPMAEALAAAVAAHREAPDQVTAAEGALLAVADGVGRHD